MPSERSSELSIFNAARLIQSSDEQKAYLRKACAGDNALEQRVEQLLSAYGEESQVLEKLAPGLEETMGHEASGDDLAASFNAELATAFSVNDAVVLGDANHIVLRSLGNTIDEVPRVSLRESQAERADPIARPNSLEVPKSDSDSRYRLDGEIARGGMGAIIRGRDTDLGCDLAIKVLLDLHKDKRPSKSSLAHRRRPPELASRVPETRVGLRHLVQFADSFRCRGWSSFVQFARRATHFGRSERRRLTSQAFVAQDGSS